jgi:TrmH family RNA methyltransferase
MGYDSATDIRFYAGLKQRRNRADSGLFLAEGRRLIEDGLRSGCPCEVVFVREGFFGRYPETDALLSLSNSVVLGERDFVRLSDTEHSQGLVAVFHSKGLVGDEPTVASLPTLFDVADPRNLGSIVRSADWFGFGELLLGESCVDPFNGKAVRSSMGAVFRTRFLLCDDLVARLAELKSRYRIVVADLDGQDYREFRNGPPAAFVFSNEARGPTAEILALADAIATIPGAGRGESLSVAVAAAVMLAALV